MTDKISFPPGSKVVVENGLCEGSVKEVVIDRFDTVLYKVEYWERGLLHSGHFSEDQLSLEPVEEN